MPKYTLKVLLDLEAADDLDARGQTTALVAKMLAGQSGVRDIILHATADHKSIRVQPDGTFEAQWNRSVTGPRK